MATPLEWLACQASGAAIINPGFEQGWNGWINSNKDGRSTGISSHHASGDHAAKLTSGAGTISQNLALRPNTHYQLTAQIKGAGIVAVKVGEQLFFHRHSKTDQWTAVSLNFHSGDADSATLICQYNGYTGYFDDFALSAVGSATTTATATLALLDNGLSPELSPGQNFKLDDWYLSTPESDRDGRSRRISERELMAGYQHPEYFYTAADGGMVMRATVAGAKTSNNTKYTRTELREMLRAGNERIATNGSDGLPNANKWVFSTAPAAAKRRAGGVDGELTATLAVNHVTSSGLAYQIGRVIIGQIHAKHDEPVRLYYRKLPGHQRGAIYAAHEPSGGDDRWYPILGSRADNAPEPSDGIALNKKFSYTIRAEGDWLEVTISRAGRQLGATRIDMRDSGYAVDDDYLYFKAGVYNQNNSGDPDDYVQATFYALHNRHQPAPR